MSATPKLADAGPAHVAIIMDGNGRWAESRGLTRSDGHREGLKATRRAVEFFANRGVQALTIFAFSSENWQRPRGEVDALFDLFVSAIEAELPELSEKGICLRFIGERADFPQPLQQRMAEAEAATAANEVMTLVVALGYGGRWDILQAAQRWLRDSAGGAPDPERFEDYLSTTGLPPVDMLIRTGGEKRISNFLLWQSAYAELFFLDTLWPDVTEQDLLGTLETYLKRQRRFGQTPHQAEARDA
ncbi:polyprenyl diphosphate synthase [Thioalkalivibrio nitratireducens]|uniref:polyprenyl diphosphate synthase n=1 Tax=Thioalkalivibrio nitratireducens TaxID=186931 RepID=UPI0012EEDF7B|nr:polyprenyl diphosphate synthase [Thioalkalivibrio nitratireducens]